MTENVKTSAAPSPRLRRVLVTLHLWLGLSVGALFVLTGLTGSLLVFHQEFDRALDPALSAPNHARPASYEAVYRVLVQRGPESEGWWSIEIPSDGGVINGRYNRTKTELRPAERRVVSIDPTTLAIKRDVVWGRYGATFVYDLHQQLLTPPPRGRTIMGLVGLAVLALLGVGVAVWWPRPGAWTRNLMFGGRVSVRRRMLEIHQLSGVYAGPLLAVVVATGTAIALPDQTKALITGLSPPISLPAPKSAPAPGARRITLDRAMAVAQAHYPQARIVWVEPPKGADGAYQVRMQASGEPSPRFPRTYVWVDPYDGRVLDARTARGEGFGDAVLTWLHPLHNGEAFGPVGRWIAFALGLLPALLFGTGLWRWAKARR